MPRASIVIPAYNAQGFIERTIASAQAQTISDIEIVCVDDGSTDQTLALLRRIAQDDPRIRVIAQENGGEGPARDTGLAAATGDWLYFLDADDLMAPTLLEKAIAYGEETGADIVVFRTMMLDDQTGERRLCEWSFKREWTADDVFCPREHPERILNSFQNWVHNKLFRGAFVRQHDLHFQHVHRTADLLFTCSALVLAQRIALLDEPLHDYRVNNPQSAMATSDSYPLDFYAAFLALRTFLEEHDLWDLYRTSFVNWAIEGVVVNLRGARSYEGYRTIADTMCGGGFRALGITDFPRDDSDMPHYYDQLRPLVDGAPAEALFRLASALRSELTTAQTDASAGRMRIGELEERSARDRRIITDQEGQIVRLTRELDETRQDFFNVTNSRSFAIGRALTKVPRAVRDLLSARRR